MERQTRIRQTKLELENENQNLKNSLNVNAKNERAIGAAFVVAALALAVGGYGLVGGFSQKDSSIGAGQAVENATPTPSEAASGSPVPSGSPDLNIQTSTLGVGEKAFLPAGTIISGDVAIADQDGGQIFRLYDTDTDKAPGITDNTQTADIVLMQQPGEVYSPYGAFVVTGLQGDRANTEFNLLYGEKQGAFAHVDKTYWTGFATTVNEVGKTEAQDPSAVITIESLQQQGGLTQPFESLQPSASSQPGQSQEPGTSIVTLPNGETITINLNCGCEIPKPTPTPTPECTATPKPTPTTEGNCTPMYDVFLKPGQKYTVSGKEFMVEGDVYIDGIRYFDNSSKTGAIDKELNTKTHTIVAPYGADVQVFNSCATSGDIQNTYNKDLQQLKTSGRSLDSNSLN